MLFRSPAAVTGIASPQLPAVATVQVHSGVIIFCTGGGAGAGAGLAVQHSSSVQVMPAHSVRRSLSVYFLVALAVGVAAPAEAAVG